MAVETKYCNKCASTKGASSFGKCSRNNDGLQSWCKECKKSNYQSKRLGIGTYSQVSYDILSTMPEKFCWSCMTMKSRSDYSIDSSRKDGMQVECKSCKHKKVAQLNKIKRHSDINVRIAINIRSRVNEMLKNKRVNKNNSSVKYIGVSVEQFKKHIEGLFVEGMNWENYGSTWHLDHIKPCSTFDFSDEKQIYKCFNYMNVQPLFATSDIAESYGHVGMIGNLNKHAKLV